MARVPITILGYRCERCDHEWIPRGDTKGDPRVCPKCKSPYWDRPRRKNPPLEYEEFRDAVQATLGSTERPMTWTEIRTKSKLPQKWPNNQWVRRLERDISLLRIRDANGIIHWSLGPEERS